MATYPYPADYPHPGLVRVQAVEAQSQLSLPRSAGVGVLLDAKAGAVPTPATKAAASASAWIRRGRDDDVQYFSLRPVWFAMQAAGFYPAHRLCRGQPGREPSPWLLLTLAQYAAVLAGQGLALATVRRTAAGALQPDFDGAIIQYLVYVQGALPMAVLPLFALQRSAFAHYLRQWVDLQEEFARESGRPLSGCRGVGSRAALQMVAVVGLWLVVAGGALLPLHPLPVVAALVHSQLVSGLLAAFWYLQGRLLRAAARALADHLGEVLSAASPQPAAVDAARLLALRLSSLSAALGRAAALPLGLLLLLHFVLQTLTLYALFGQLSHETQRAARVPGLLAGVLFSGAVLFVCCDTGHRVAEAVKSGVLQEVMAFRRRAAQLGEDLHYMVETFITSVQEVPSDVTLSGVTTVNRQLFTAILSTMVTYLVVVVQFRVSLEAQEEEGGTSTNTSLGIGTTVLPQNLSTVLAPVSLLSTASEAEPGPSMPASVATATTAVLEAVTTAAGLSSPTDILDGFSTASVPGP